MALEGEILVGRYRVLRELGSGGMGTVFLAEHIHLGRPTAVKLLRSELSSDPDAEARFRREALLAAKLMHPAVAQIFDFDRTPDGRFLIAMEYVEGETVAQRLRREGPFPVAMAINILRGIADGLDRAHALGIIHRDIKPDNVMLAAGGAVKLLDFGVARDIATNSSGGLTSAGIAVGTPAYMSPEQLVGEAPTATSDVYALGTALYEMLTGRQPHTGATFAEFRARRLMNPPPRIHTIRPEISTALAAVVARALEIEPAARWPTAGAFARAAADAIGGVSTRDGNGTPTDSVGDEPRAVGLDAQFETLRLAGRDRETRIVRDAWAAARTGRTTVLWIEGEEGAGKSIFFRVAQREAIADSAVALVGRGYQTELTPPYGPWIPMLRSALTLRAAKERSWPAITALTDARSERAAPERSALYDEIAVLLSAAAARGPVFLGMDDIDWCDPASVSLFEYLSHALADVPILLATTATTDRVGAASHGAELGRQTRERLRRLDHTVWLSLRPLGYEPVAAWLTRALGTEAPDELVRFVYGHTEGNAFFIEQVVRSLVEHGNMERMSSETGRIALVDYPPPEAVADVVQRRLAGMSETAREVLQIAAVTGREFDVDMVVALSKHSEDAVLDALDEATAAGVLEPVTGAAGDRYRFTQHKIAQVLAQAMNGRRRRRMHGRVAEVLSGRDPGQVASGALAWHWYHAGEMARASIAARAAARQALALHAYDDALTFGAMSAEAASTPAERREAHELRGDALRRLDREAEAAAAYAHARLVGTGGSSGVAAIGEDDAVRTLRRKELRSALRAGTVSAAIVIAEARKLLEGSDALPAVRRCAHELLLAEALVEGSEHEAAIETARRAEVAAREANDTSQIVDAMLVLGAALLCAARTADAAAAAREACVICDSLGEPYVSARAALLKGAVEVLRDDRVAARSAYADALRHAERAQVPRLVRQVRERQAEIAN